MRISIYIMIIFSSLGLFSVIFVNTFNDNILDLGFTQSYYVRSLFPEGWGFFTRSPRQNNFVLYQQFESNLEKVTKKNTRLEHFYGCSRKGRRINMEIARIQKQIPMNLWKDAKGKDLKTVMQEMEPATIVTAPEEFDFHFLTNGTYILEKSKITPWMYSHFPGHYEPDISYLKFKITGL